MTQLPDESGALWYDDEAGPMVRPYTVTRGRTHSMGGAREMDVIALVSLVDPPSPGADDGDDRPDAAFGAAASGAGSVATVGATVDAASAGSPQAPGGSAGAVGIAEPETAAGGVEGVVPAAVGASGDSAATLGRWRPSDGGYGGPGVGGPLREEHLALLDQCRTGPLSVAELAAGADLPLGVVRVLLGDLLDLGRVRVTRPVSPAELPNVDLLQHLIAGLKSL